MASVKVHTCGKITRSKITGYKSKTAIVRLRFMFHYCIPPQQTANQPRPERRQRDKELISSPRELNSSRSGMEYRSHSGAKRRLPPTSATRTPAHTPRAAPILYFQQVNATATGIGTAAHNCFSFSSCHIATGKRLIFRAYWL